jgi:hypothetical protein
MKNTVFILGAGATRGCSFVNDMKRQGHCVPPLDGDYFMMQELLIGKTRLA